MEHLRRQTTTAATVIYHYLLYRDTDGQPRIMLTFDEWGCGVYQG